MKLKRETQHKLRVLLSEMDHLVIAEGQPVQDLGSEFATYVSDWDLLSRYLAPEVILHTEVSSSGGRNRSRAVWFTVTEVPMSEQLTVHNVETILENVNTSVGDALNTLGSAVSRLPEKDRPRVLATLKTLRRQLLS